MNPHLPATRTSIGQAGISHLPAFVGHKGQAGINTDKDFFRMGFVYVAMSRHMVVTTLKNNL
jgi:hypothetical protein